MEQLLLTAVLLFVFANVFRAQENPWSGTSADLTRGKLKISENKRFLIFEDGTPFYYLGDTGWELFHRLNKDEIEKSLEKFQESSWLETTLQKISKVRGYKK